MRHEFRFGIVPPLTGSERAQWITVILDLIAALERTSPPRFPEIDTVYDGGGPAWWTDRPSASVLLRFDTPITECQLGEIVAWCRRQAAALEAGDDERVLRSPLVLAGD